MLWASQDFMMEDIERIKVIPDITWAVQPALELSLVGQNLLQAHHPEQAFALSSSGMTTEVQRGVYGKVTWQF